MPLGKFLPLILTFLIPSITFAEQKAAAAKDWIVDLHFYSDANAKPMISKIWAHIRPGTESPLDNNFHHEGDFLTIYTIGPGREKTEVFYGNFLETFYSCRDGDVVFRSSSKNSKASCQKFSTQFLEASFRSKGHFTDLSFQFEGKELRKVSFVEVALLGLVGTSSLKDEVEKKGLIDRKDPCGSLKKINEAAKSKNLPDLQWSNFNLHAPRIESFFGCPSSWKK